MISIIIPTYNCADSLPRTIDSILNNTYKDIEIIVVDDGSTDGTQQTLTEYAQKNNCIKALFFSRNFGHQAALNAGLDYTTGDAVVIMDADLQHPPELIGKMYEEFSKGYDIVLGKRESNEQNGVLRDKIGGLFYRLVSKISNVDLQANVADFGLFSKDVIEVVKQLPEHDRFLRGLMQWVGFKKTYINYKAGLRYTGKSKYSFKKLVNLGMSGITSFSAFPLRLSWWAGLLIFILSIFYSLYIIIDYFFISGRVVAGWPSLIVVICLLGGFQLMMVGVIGEYLFRIFNEIKGRPLYILSKKIGFNYDVRQVKSNYGISTK
jgi:dolichol-phosphate mannosyltransferase